MFSFFSRKRSLTRREVLDSAELQIVDAFDEDGESSVPELAVAVKLKPSAVTKVVDQLTQKHYLRRQNPNSLCVELTKKGQGLRKESRTSSSL